MDHSFWQERWQSGQVGFHKTEVNPLLVAHAPLLAASPARVLVPLCGKTLDLGWLAARGHEVWGVEFVEAAARTYFEEAGVLAEELQRNGALALRHGRVTILVADFFSLRLRAVELFSALYDRAALIAVPPADRRRYLEQLRALATPDARLLLVTLDHDMGTGPPFAVEPGSLAGLCDGLFDLALVAEEDVLAAEPRFRERGATRFVNRVWAGRAR